MNIILEMSNLLPKLLLGLIFTLLIGVSSVSAQVPRRYYDWSSTLDTKGISVLGVESEATASALNIGVPQSYTQFNRYLFGGNFTPDNPLYFVKTVQENIQLTMTFDPIQKEQMRLAMSGERLFEMQQLIGANKPQAFASAASSYQSTMETMAARMEDLKQQGTNFDTLLTQVEQETAKHTIVLQTVVVKVSDQSKDPIEKAIEASQMGSDTVADLSGEPALPSDVADRLQALKAQGLLTPEEVNKLVSIKSRSEVRMELKKYVTEGVVPEADFLGLDQNVKSLYKDEFFKLHEMKRFYELKRLENEKPDEVTLGKIQEFAKTYKPGDVVPADIRKYWVPVVRLEEIQNTLRPDLIDADLLKTNQGDYQKFQEIVERFKPRPEDMAYLESYLKKNPDATLPPEYERMKNLAAKYGAQCGQGYRWMSQPQSGGMCVPEGGGNYSNQMPRMEDFAKGKTCSGVITAAKGPNGSCSAYPADCIPPGWTKTDRCGGVYQSEAVGLKNSENPLKQRSCPTNSHFVPVPYMPDGGYCIPNYTTYDTNPGSSGGTNMTDIPCPAGYHRSYQGGPCLIDYSSGTSTVYSLPPITANPGAYPSPLYPTYSTSRENQETMCRSGGGSCDWSSGTCNCQGYQTPTTTYSGSTSCQVSCPSGQYLDRASCSCRNSADYPSRCSPPSSGCGTSAYWDYGSCACRSGSSTPANMCQGLSCGSGQYLDYSTCSCKDGSYTPSYSTPPSGYGTCSSGQYWNGSSCVSSTSSGGSTTSSGMSREQQESTCRSGGGTCSWNGDTCNCQGYQSPSGTTSTQPTSAPQPQPTSAPQETQPQPTNPPSTNTTDPSTACASAGGSWNGSTCQMP